MNNWTKAQKQAKELLDAYTKTTPTYGQGSSSVTFSPDESKEVILENGAKVLIITSPLKMRNLIEMEYYKKFIKSRLPQISSIGENQISDKETPKLMAYISSCAQAATLILGDPDPIGFVLNLEQKDINKIISSYNEEQTAPLETAEEIKKK